jgi:hypothetical protein
MCKENFATEDNEQETISIRVLRTLFDVVPNALFLIGSHNIEYLRKNSLSVLQFQKSKITCVSPNTLLDSFQTHIIKN